MIWSLSLPKYHIQRVDMGEWAGLMQIKWPLQNKIKVILCYKEMWQDSWYFLTCLWKLLSLPIISKVKLRVSIGSCVLSLQPLSLPFPNSSHLLFSQDNQIVYQEWKMFLFINAWFLVNSFWWAEQRRERMKKSKENLFWNQLDFWKWH